MPVNLRGAEDGILIRIKIDGLKEPSCMQHNFEADCMTFQGAAIPLALSLALLFLKKTPARPGFLLSYCTFQCRFVLTLVQGRH